MIDRIISAYSSVRHIATDKNYRPDQAITHKRLSNKNADILTVLIPPWHGGGIVYSVLAARLCRRNSAVLRYSFHRQILEANVDRVVASFMYVRDAIVSDIEALRLQNGYKEVRFVSSSLGNVAMCLVADAYPDFTEATMIVAGSNLARCAWEGSRTTGLRHQLAQQGIDEDMLDKAWESLRPMKYAAAFTGKKLNIMISGTDKIIPTSYQKQMLATLSTFNSRIMVQYVKTGHSMTIAGYCFKPI